MGIEHDHIFGRISNSPLNLSPLCPKCHYEKIGRGLKGKIEQLKWTAEYLANRFYKLTQKDNNFLESLKYKT